MKNHSKMFVAGGLLACLLFMTVGYINITDPALLGLTRETPYLSTWSEQFLTNSSSASALNTLGIGSQGGQLVTTNYVGQVQLTNTGNIFFGTFNGTIVGGVSYPNSQVFMDSLGNVYYFNGQVLMPSATAQLNYPNGNLFANSGSVNYPNGNLMAGTANGGSLYGTMQGTSTNVAPLGGGPLTNSISGNAATATFAMTATNATAAGVATNSLNSQALGGAAASGYITNNYGLELKYDGLSNLWAALPYDGRTINEFALWHFENAINKTNQPVLPNIYTGNLFGWYLDEYDGKASASPTVNIASNDTNWFGTYAWLPAGSGVTNQLLPGNNVRFAGIIQPGGGNVNIYTCTSFGGPLTQIASISLYSSTGWNGFETNISVPFGYYEPVVYSSTAVSSNIVIFTCCDVSNSTRILTTGDSTADHLYHGGPQLGIASVFNNIGCPGTEMLTIDAVGDQVINGWAEVPTNVFWPIMQGLDPNLVIISSKNSNGAQIITNAATFENLFTNGCPDADLCWIGTFPDYGTGWDFYGINYAEWLVGKTYGQFFFDGYDQMPQNTNWYGTLSGGYGWSVDGVHLIGNSPVNGLAGANGSIGSYVWGGLIARELRRCIYGENYLGNGIPYWNVNGNQTNGGNLYVSNYLFIAQNPNGNGRPLQLVGGSSAQFIRYATYNNQYGGWDVGQSITGNAFNQIGGGDFQFNPLNSSGGYQLPLPALEIGTNGNIFAFGSGNFMGLTVSNNTAPDTIALRGGNSSQVIRYYSYGGTYGSWRVGQWGIGAVDGALDWALQPLSPGGSPTIYGINGQGYGDLADTNGDWYIYGNNVISNNVICWGNYYGNGVGLTNVPVSSITDTRAGETNLSSATSVIVVFSSPLSQVTKTNYSVAIGPFLSAITTPEISNKTTNGFTATFSSFTGDLDYTVTPWH